MLLGQDRKIDRPAVDARRRAGLEAPDARHQLAQSRGEFERRRVAGTTARLLLEPDVDASAEERADGEHDRARGEGDATHGRDAHHSTALDHEVGGLLLEELQVRLVLEEAAHRATVELSVGLGASRAHRRTLAGIEGAELDAGAIDPPRHHSAERVDLAHQVPLADAPERRVATHLAEGLDALRQQEGVGPHARSRGRSLGTGMATADDDHIECLCEAQHNRVRIV